MIDTNILQRFLPKNNYLQLAPVNTQVTDVDINAVLNQMEEERNRIKGEFTFWMPKLVNNYGGRFSFIYLSCTQAPVFIARAIAGVASQEDKNYVNNLQLNGGNDEYIYYLSLFTDKPRVDYYPVFDSYYKSSGINITEIAFNALAPKLVEVVGSINTLVSVVSPITPSPNMPFADKIEAFEATRQKLTSLLLQIIYAKGQADATFKNSDLYKLFSFHIPEVQVEKEEQAQKEVQAKKEEQVKKQEEQVKTNTKLKYSLVFFALAGIAFLASKLYKNE